MTTAAEIFLNRTEMRMHGSADMPLPRLDNPHEVAARLFDELGLQRLLEEALAECDPLVMTVNRFAQGVAEAEAGDSHALAPTDEAPVEADPARALASDALDAATAAMPADAAAAMPALAEVAAEDFAAEDEGYFIEVPFVTEERYEHEGTWMSDRADAAADSWLGVDPSQPREWTPDDLMMLIYRDRAQVSEAAARLAGLDDDGAHDPHNDLDGFADAA